MGKAGSAKKLKTYALLSHESAVEGVWALAARGWREVLDDENVWLVPAPESCVTTQGDLKRLESEVDLAALGIRRRPIELLVPNKTCYSRGKRAKFHVWSEFFPPHSFVRVHDRVLVSTPYFASLQLAMACRADRLSQAEAEASAVEDAIAREKLGIPGGGSTAAELARWGNIARLARATQVLCDFMGTYRYVPSADGGGINEAGIVYQTKPLIIPSALDSYLDEMGSVRGIERARRVASLALARSASPMETVLALMLSLPLEAGGFGLPRPELNWELPLLAEERELSSQDEVVIDACWPKQRVAVEYYGWDDHFGAGPRKVASDASRANTLAALGWTVLHATYEQVRTVAGMSLLARQIAQALGVSLEEPSELELVWRMRLLALLLPKTGQGW